MEPSRLRGLRAGVRRLLRLPLRTAEHARADADEELASFLEARVESLVARGLSAADARAEALRRLGGASMDEVRERLHRSAELREERMHSRERLDTVRHDVRYDLRRMRAEPAFTAFAAGILALGVAATTAVFSIVSPLLLRPLPFREPGRLVWIAQAPPGGGAHVTSRAAAVREYRARARSFEAVTGYFAFFELESVTLLGAGAPQRLVGVGVARDFLETLGVRPLLGRNFVAEESVPSGRPAAILTHAFWARRFGADAGIVGRAITLNGVPTTVVGVLPRSFDFASTFAPASRVDFLRPFPVGAEADRLGSTLWLIGRLRPGVTAPSAQAELAGLHARLEPADPGRWRSVPVVTGLQQQIAGGFRAPLLLLAAGAGLVLLLACANLSNLLLARGQQRARELAVRRALGAGRGRVLAQLLVESVLLAVGGGALGALLAAVVTRWAAAAGAARIPLLAAAAVDTRALAFALVVTLLTGLAAGLAPALRVTPEGAGAALRDAGRGASAGRRRVTARELLVVGEVAVACVLLVAGGLLLRSFVHVLRTDLGFEPGGAVAWQLEAGRDLRDDAARAAFFADVAARVAAVPGVEAVGLTDTPPLGRNRDWDVRAEGVAYERGTVPAAYPRLVDAGYLRTMRIPLLAGRHFTAEDGATSPRVVVLNRSAAAALFPGRDPIGRNVLLGDAPWRVVGVVGDVRHRSPEAEAGLEVYVPIAQDPPYSRLSRLVLVVRSPLPTASLAAGVTAALRAADPAMPTGDFQPLEAAVDRVMLPRRFVLEVLGAFDAAALLLAALGIYAVLSYAVTQRVREIGVRLALGESAAGVRRRVVGRTLLLAGTGVGAGGAVSLAGAGLIRSLLYGVGPTDGPTFACVAALLLAVAALAGYLPARRASRTDPVVALRSA